MRDWRVHLMHWLVDFLGEKVGTWENRVNEMHVEQDPRCVPGKTTRPPVKYTFPSSRSRAIRKSSCTNLAYTSASSPSLHSRVSMRLTSRRHGARPRLSAFARRGSVRPSPCSRCPCLPAWWMTDARIVWGSASGGSLRASRAARYSSRRCLGVNQSRFFLQKVRERKSVSPVVSRITRGALMQPRRRAWIADGSVMLIRTNGNFMGLILEGVL